MTYRARCEARRWRRMTETTRRRIVGCQHRLKWWRLAGDLHAHCDGWCGGSVTVEGRTSVSLFDILRGVERASNGHAIIVRGSPSFKRWVMTAIEARLAEERKRPLPALGLYVRVHDVELFALRCRGCEEDAKRTGAEIWQVPFTTSAVLRSLGRVTRARELSMVCEYAMREAARHGCTHVIRPEEIRT